MYTVDQIYIAGYKAGIDLDDIFNLTNILEKLRNPQPEGSPPEPFVPDNLTSLIRQICEIEQVSYSDIICKDRHEDLVRVRAAYCAIAKWFWGKTISVEKIGHAIGIDHATVIYHVKNSRDLPYRKKEYEEIRGRLNINNPHEKIHHRADRIPQKQLS